MYKMNWGFIFLAVIIYIVIVGCLCSSIRVVPYTSDRAYKSVTENFEELNATNNYVTALGETPEPISCRKVHGFKDLQCCPNAKPKQIAEFGIVKGKPRCADGKQLNSFGRTCLNEDQIIKRLKIRGGNNIAPESQIGP